MTTKERKPIDAHHPLTRTDSSGLHDHQDRSGNLYCIRGHVGTPHGYVAVYYYIWTDKQMLELKIIRDGICYERNYVNAYERRTIVTLANRFAREIAERTPR